MTFYFYMYHLRNTGVGACFRIPSKVYIFFFKYTSHDLHKPISTLEVFGNKGFLFFY